MHFLSPREETRASFMGGKWNYLLEICQCVYVLPAVDKRRTEAFIEASTHSCTPATQIAAMSDIRPLHLSLLAGIVFSSMFGDLS